MLKQNQPVAAGSNVEQKSNPADTDQSPRRESAAAKDGAGSVNAGTQQTWPDQLLQAKSFTPAQATAAAPNRSWLKITATIAITISLGWISADYIFKADVASSKQADRQTANKITRLMEEEKSTLARVLSDLRILQSAYANVQSQITSLPTRQDQQQDKRQMLSKLNKVNRALAAVRKRSIAMHKDRTAIVAGLAQRLAASEQARSKSEKALNERLAKLEKALAETHTKNVAKNLNKNLNKSLAKNKSVASVQTNQAAQNQRTPANLSSISRGVHKVARNYVLRDVYRGSALVEGRSGLVEVVPGMYLPGAGRVQSIKRRSGKWVVVTSRGIINSQSY